MNRFDYDTNDWAINNVCSGAGLYGHDGSMWAHAGDFPGLTTYQHPLEQMDGSTQNVECNETLCAMLAADGNRMPCEAGIRMCGAKYMLTYKDEESAIAQLTTRGGGACVGKTF